MRLELPLDTCFVRQKFAEITPYLQTQYDLPYRDEDLVIEAITKFLESNTKWHQDDFFEWYPIWLKVNTSEQNTLFDFAREDRVPARDKELDPDIQFELACYQIGLDSIKIAESKSYIPSLDEYQAILSNLQHQFLTLDDNEIEIFWFNHKRQEVVQIFQCGLRHHSKEIPEPLKNFQTKCVETFPIVDDDFLIQTGSRELEEARFLLEQIEVPIAVRNLLVAAFLRVDQNRLGQTRERDMSLHEPEQPDLYSNHIARVWRYVMSFLDEIQRRPWKASPELRQLVQENLNDDNFIILCLTAIFHDEPEDYKITQMSSKKIKAWVLHFLNKYKVKTEASYNSIADQVSQNTETLNAKNYPALIQTGKINPLSGKTQVSVRDYLQAVNHGGPIVQFVKFFGDMLDNFSTKPSLKKREKIRLYALGLHQAVNLGLLELLTPDRIQKFVESVLHKNTEGQSAVSMNPTLKNITIQAITKLGFENLTQEVQERALEQISQLRKS